MKFQVCNIAEFKRKALFWAQGFEASCMLDGSNMPYPFGGFPQCLGVGVRKHIVIEEPCDIAQLQYLLNEKEEELWLGYISYDLKNGIERLESQNPSHFVLPAAYFFQPAIQIYFGADTIEIIGEGGNAIFDEINSIEKPEGDAGIVDFSSLVSREEYLGKVAKIQSDILDGEVYEMNYCMPFLAQSTNFNPVEAYLSLSEESPSPFGGIFKLGDRYVLCASPERFIKKQNAKLISQPIKGTAKKGESRAEDEQQKKALLASEKERAENLMIVDLVRNDLAKVGISGKTTVEELFGIYTFRQLHQMISTVSTEVPEGTSFLDIIKALFPMGSMTGAPKVRAMQLIEEYESVKRGAYSGSMGYINGQDFDFNVVIRSLFYDAETKQLSFEVGSAITIDSVPEQEYEECLLKAKAIFNVFGRAAELLKE